MLIDTRISAKLHKPESEDWKKKESILFAVRCTYIRVRGIDYSWKIAETFLCGRGNEWKKVQINWSTNC